MIKNNKKSHLTTILHYWIIVFILGIATSVTAIDIISSYRNIALHSQKIRSDYIAAQQSRIQEEVMRVVRLIRDEREQASSLTKRIVKSRVLEALAIAQNISQVHQDDNDPLEIQKMIIDALRPIRFEDGKGHYFMTAFDGTELLFADRPEWEGKNLLDLQDRQGQYVVRDMIAICQQRGKGFYQYSWTKPGTKGNTFKKISFIQRIPGTKTLLGTELYIDDFEQKIEKQLLATISKIRFNQKGYIFINTFAGNTLVANGNLYSGSQKLWEIFNKDPKRTKDLFAQEKAAALTPTGDFISYRFKKMTQQKGDSPKSSFIYGIPELQWLVGAGVYLDDVEDQISQLQDSLAILVKRKIINSILISLGILVLLLPFSRRLNRRLEKDISLFNSFFNNFGTSNAPIDRTLLELHEFDQMAKDINIMVSDRVTAQRRLDQERKALLHSEEKYRNTMDSTLIGVYIIQDFKFKYVNPKMVEMFGYSADKMLKDITPFDLIVPEQRQQIKDNLIRRVAGEIGQTTDIKCLRRNGEIFYAMTLSARTIHQGKPASVGTLIDISKRKEAEERLRQSEMRATALLKAIPDMVFRINKDGLTLDATIDPTLSSFQGDGDIIGKNISDVFPNPIAALIATNILNTLSSGAMHTFEYQLSHASQELLYFETRMVKSGTDEVICMVRNITERKKEKQEKVRLEQQLNRGKRLESIGIMAGGVAHDLNNILSGIVGYPELILHDMPATNPLRGQIEAIQQSGIRAAAIVDDLLTVARGAASTRALYDLNHQIMEYLASLECKRLETLYPKISITCNLQAEQNTISCSQVHIKKCLMNLVSNGVEAIQGSGDVVISTHNHTLHGLEAADQKLPPGEYIVLEVRDNGPGIAKEDQEHIFEPFYSKKMMARSGTGLGLTVVWNTVQDHNGTILVSSTEGGTSFELYFPVSLEKAGPPSLADGAPPLAEAGEIILIVDDDPMVLDVTRQLIASLGYQVESVASGEEAVLFIQKTPVDLLIIDMLMDPGIDGYQTYKEILAIHPGQRAIIASGFSENNDVKATLALGATTFIKKPYSLHRIATLIQKALLA